ncbi:hypothetical protein Tco_1184217 [Tanacetum coccineum]
MSRELRSTVDDIFLRMVDNLEAWNDFPWGEHIWRELYVAIINVNSKHKDEHHKALKKNFVPSESLYGFLLCFKTLKSSSVTGRWWSKFSKEIPRGCSWSKHLPFQNEYFGQLFPSLMILPKEMKSLKARVYKLETIIHVITRKKKVNIQSTRLKQLVKRIKWRVLNGVVEVDKLSEKYLSEDDCVKDEKEEAKINRLAEQRRQRLKLRLEDENSMKSIELSNSNHVKLALKRCGTIKRRCQDLKPWDEELNRPIKCIDTIFYNFELEKFLITSGWRRCKFPWCNDIVVDRLFWDSLIGLDNYRVGWLHDEETGVFASKGIDLTDYSIKFRHAQNVPKSAHEIPLGVEDLIQIALAYREKMVNFFFKHKIICPR